MHASIVVKRVIDLTNVQNQKKPVVVVVQVVEKDPVCSSID
jgi:hypothetical protein